MHYRYLKKIPALTTDKAASSLVLNLIPAMMLVIGAFLISSATVPILAYQFLFSPQFNELKSPLPDKKADGLQKSMVLSENKQIDMLQAQNWFPEAPSLPPRPSKITSYSLSVPKLKIEKATVEIDGQDLKESLIHYKGTALPGQKGTAVIFGHSTLPQLFNPKNYVTIFSTLPTLKKGDQIKLDFDGVSYIYQVFQLKETSATDFTILDQNFEDSYLTLVTCVPPGTYLRRLAASAKLLKI